MRATTITVEIAGNTLDVLPITVDKLAVGTAQVVNGRCSVLGWSLANTGSAATTVTLGDGSTAIVRGAMPVVIAAGGDAHQWMPHPTAAVSEGLAVTIADAGVTGTVWVGLPRVGN